MNHVIIIPTLILLILLIYSCKSQIYNYNTLTNKCNEIDGRCYKIVNTFAKNTHLTASQILAYLNQFSIKLLRYMRKKFLWERKGDIYKYRITKELLHNYNPNSIIENNPINDVNTSYVENKGKVFAICLREKKTGNSNFIDTHSLEFVVLHEMAHLASFKYGHEEEFWINFKILLENAYEMGIHQPKDYKKNPMYYCSLFVNYNPFYDKNIQTS
jgi:hypothetical protein